MTRFETLTRLAVYYTIGISGKAMIEFTAPVCLTVEGATPVDFVSTEEKTDGESQDNGPRATRWIVQIGTILAKAEVSVCPASSERVTLQ